MIDKLHCYDQSDETALTNPTALADRSDARLSYHSQQEQPTLLLLPGCHHDRQYQLHWLETQGCAHGVAGRGRDDRPDTEVATLLTYSSSNQSPLLPGCHQQRQY